MVRRYGLPVFNLLLAVAAFYTAVVRGVGWAGVCLAAAVFFGLAALLAWPVRDEGRG